jgi:hypothetical protein
MYIYTPNAPSISTNNLITSSRVDLTITPPGINGGSAITSYKIYINGNYTGSIGYAGTTTTYSATALTASTQYNFYATAVNAIGEGSPSTASIKTTMNAPRVSAAAVVDVYSATKQINLTILPPLNNIQRNPITSYKIYINGNSTSAGSSTADASGNATYTASSLSINTGYSFTVSAVSIDGEGAKSSAASATTSDLVPNAPAVTATVISSTQIDISFTASASNGGSAITSYDIYYNNGGLLLKTVTATAATSYSYSVTGLTANTSYRYFVRGVNNAGNGGNGYSLNVTTPPLPISAPSGVTNIHWNGDGSISWDPPAFNGNSPIVNYSWGGETFDEYWGYNNYGGGAGIYTYVYPGQPLFNITIYAFNAAGYYSETYQYLA